MADDELLDLDEDLFDFDELLRDVEQFSEEASSMPLPTAAPRKQPSPAAPLPASSTVQPASPPVTHQPHRRPPPLPPRPVAPAPAVAASAPPAQAPADAPAAPRRRLAISRGTAVAISAISVLQIFVLFLVVQAVNAVRGMARDVGDRTTIAANEAPVQAQQPAPAPVQDAAPAAEPPSEGELALERADDLLRRGDYERARETLYSLLAVVDRLPARTRRDVEARARFLVADTWRLEAEVSEDLAALASEQEPPGEEPPR